MTSWEGVSVISVYLTTIIWCAIALGAYIDCWREWAADKAELESTVERSFSVFWLVAKSRYKRATYFVKMAHMKVFTGLAALTLVLFFVPPQPDASPIQFALRLFLILDIYWFWRAKRTDRALREQMRATRGKR